jgi:two-component system chemotaxis response regulator CheB
MADTRIVVIGTSAGGLDALRTIVANLPADFPAPIAIVMHTAPASPGVLAGILGRAGPLPAIAVTGVEPLNPATIYVAAPDYHLIVEPGRVRATRGPKENRFRPAIDPLFRSAAQVYGPGAVGVILTGNLDDGTAGLWTLKQLGGTAIVQDPADALCASMPESALRQVRVDHCVPVTEIAPLLVAAVTGATGRGEFAVPEETRTEVDIAKERHPMEAGLEAIGEPSPYACPECHGVLLRLKADGPARFRCHTGHAYSAESLMAEVDAKVDEALWNAIRALEEAELLWTRMSPLLAHRGSPALAAQGYDAGDSRRYADVLRKIASERVSWEQGDKRK